MKAILASSDITKVLGGVEMAEQMTGKDRKDINIAVINEASAVEFQSSRWAIKELCSFADTFGGSIEIVHILALTPAQIRERLMANDMIFVMGGNNEWLKIVFDKTGISEMLPEILKEKVYVGGSAGSMILGRQPAYSACKEESFGVTSLLNILDFAFLPHYLNIKRGRDEAWAIQESKHLEFPVYAISDKAAVVVNSDEISVIGEGYLKLQNGEIIRP